MRGTPSPRTGRLRSTPFVIGSGLLGAVLLSASMTGSLAGFTAAIRNTADTAASGTLVMQEQPYDGSTVTCTSTDGGSVSTNSATCSTIDDFGAPAAMTPGADLNNPVEILNTGTIDARTFTLTPGATCTQSSTGAAGGTATDLCSRLHLLVFDSTSYSTVWSGTLADLAGSGPITLSTVAAGGQRVFNFDVSLPTGLDNGYQGLKATLPLTWTFTS